MATGASVNLIPAIIGTITATDINTFEAALLNALDDMSDEQIKPMIFYPNWGGSLSGGAYSFGFLLKITTNVYKVSLMDACVTGYYYSGAWHWQRATMSSFTP